MLQLQRPITSGSRQAPDPYDQFLESRCLYRKHTARDASSLFRVIAEQMYDTQMLHYEVRLECVRFMTQKRRIFEQHVNGDFDSYMMDMAKPKTYGTMLELRAMCCMYRRNVILFEPFNLGSSVTFSARYNQNFRVFYTNENHYDSIYTLDYIETAAICQSIAFKLLYKMLFKLPDVNFAIETMLHPHTFEWGTYEVEYDSVGYITRLLCCDGRSFQLDLPEGTSCILENYKLCNFHNNKQLQQQQQNSARGAGKRRDRDRELTMSAELNGVNGVIGKVLATSESSELLQMCPNRLMSCVRQLLDDGITPFPYKVAKSLDPYMYRNIEFDCWNDLRKEAKRFNTYAGDYNFKVGAKCRVELDGEMYTCHIQKLTKNKSYFIAYVEHFGKKLLVPYEAMHPLPPDEFRPWTVPYRYQRQINKVQLSKFVHKSKMQRWKRAAKLFELGTYFEASKCETVQQYLHLDNFAPPIMDYASYPLFVNSHGQAYGHNIPNNNAYAAEQQHHHQQSVAVESEQPRLRQNVNLGLSQPNVAGHEANVNESSNCDLHYARARSQRHLQQELQRHHPRERFQRFNRRDNHQPDGVAGSAPPTAAVAPQPQMQAQQQPPPRLMNYMPITAQLSPASAAAAGTTAQLSALPPWRSLAPTSPLGMLGEEFHNIYAQPAPPAQYAPDNGGNGGCVYMPFGYPPPPPGPHLGGMQLPPPLQASYVPLLGPAPYGGLGCPVFPSPPHQPQSPCISSPMGARPPLYGSAQSSPDRGDEHKVPLSAIRGLNLGGNREPLEQERERENSGEPRRSLRVNGEDLPADVGTLRYFYNMGVDMHLRLATHIEPTLQPHLSPENGPGLMHGRVMTAASEPIGVYAAADQAAGFERLAHLQAARIAMGDANNAPEMMPHHLSHNTDQQQHENLTANNGTPHEEVIDEAAAVVVTSTPPPSPDCHSGAGVGIGMGNMEASVGTTPLPLAAGTHNSTYSEPARAKRPYNKSRGAKRQDSVDDTIHFNNNCNNNNNNCNNNNKIGGNSHKFPMDFKADLSHPVLLPTPTPSPTTNGSQFTFFPTVQAQAPPPMPLLQPPPPIFLAHKSSSSQNHPIAWGMAPNIVGLPFELHNNIPLTQGTVGDHAVGPQPQPPHYNAQRH